MMMMMMMIKSRCTHSSKQQHEATSKQILRLAFDLERVGRSLLWAQQQNGEMASLAPSGQAGPRRWVRAAVFFRRA